MTKTVTLLIAFAMVAGSIAFLHRPITRASVRPAFLKPTCGDQYNALVLKAKQSLAGSDRASAIRALIRAREQLQHCEELQEHDAEAPHAIS